MAQGSLKYPLLCAFKGFYASESAPGGTSAVPAAPLPCSCPRLPFSQFCATHILFDPEQELFAQCGHVSASSGVRCAMPALRMRDELMQTAAPLCRHHTALYSAADAIEGAAPSAPAMPSALVPALEGANRRRAAEFTRAIAAGVDIDGPASQHAGVPGIPGAGTVRRVQTASSAVLAEQLTAIIHATQTRRAQLLTYQQEKDAAK
jgi:hypothetical protein